MVKAMASNGACFPVMMMGPAGVMEQASGRSERRTSFREPDAYGPLQRLTTPPWGKGKHPQPCRSCSALRLFRERCRRAEVSGLTLCATVTSC